MVRCNAIDKLINGSRNNVTTVADTKEVCDSAQGECDTVEGHFAGHVVTPQQK